MFIVQKNTHEWTKSQTQMEQIWETISLHWIQTDILLILLQHLYFFCSKSKQNRRNKIQCLRCRTNSAFSQQTNKQTKCQKILELFTFYKSSFWFTKQISITYQFFTLWRNSLVWCFGTDFALEFLLWNIFGNCIGEINEFFDFLRNMWMIFRVVRDWLVRNFFKNIGGEGLFRQRK